MNDNSFMGGVTPSKIARAAHHNPDGVVRLARFVGCESVEPAALAHACWQHRLAGYFVVDRAAAHAARFLVES